MRSRHVTIILTILTILAPALFALSLLDSEAQAATSENQFSAVADTLSLYEEMLFVGPDGNAFMEITIVTAKGGSGDLLLPFDFDAGENFMILSGPAVFKNDSSGVPSETIQVLGRQMLNLQTQEYAAAGDTIRVGADIPDWFKKEETKKPYGEFNLARHFVNYSVFVLRDFRINLVLPPKMVVHSIVDIVPDYNPRNNPKPPYAVSRLDDRIVATIVTQNLSPAETSLLDINIRPSKRSLIPLIGGIIAALLYLIFFRDVLKPVRNR